MHSFRRLLTIATFAAATFLLAPAVAPALAQTVAIPSHSGHTPTVMGSLVDINTATPQQLKSLPGIGDAYVKRIIAGRPYTAKNQLVTRGILPQGVYARISGSIIAQRPRK